ncbi:hypothetical protein O6H91_22G066600 [Diphasiastrum complanatum]|nr:hypothetical protein O6H91_22G066600 [Diphasiastrum complanatum]KAJ7516661.1 hypothetical protein O6H91_22G066600 [Diphasiastrum complanatum]
MCVSRQDNDPSASEVSSSNNNINSSEFLREMCSTTDERSSKFEKGRLDYGCTHYRRRCRLRAPCCNEIFSCRHCHNAAKDLNESDLKKRHDLPRHRVEKVICSLCNTEQDVQQVCQNCGTCMGAYFCHKCKFFDDDTSRQKYHCDSCGICRIGSSDKFFHCQKCGCCYPTSLQQGHPCVENAMHHNCPVCYEYLFDSVKEISVMRCGHTIHLGCLKELCLHSHFACPVCSKTISDMSHIWASLDREVAATVMPEELRNKVVWILCNDCGVYNEVCFHIIAQKCPNCSSYNTRKTKGGPCAVSSSA